MDLNTEQETLRELSSRKQNLLLELKNYEANQTASLGNNMLQIFSVFPYNIFSIPGGGPGVNKSGGFLDNDMGMIPAQTQLQTALAINLGSEGQPVSRNIVLSSKYFYKLNYFLVCPQDIL